MNARKGDPTSGRLLVVEDEGIVAMDLAATLERMGYHVVQTTETGEEAVEIATREPIDLILMDIHLGGKLDGIEAAAIILENKDIPIVYLTAYTDEETLRRAKIIGPYGYVVKPYDERELHSAIEIALYKHGIERRLRESEKRLDSILSSINDAVIATDPDHKITFINPAAAHLFGVDPAAVRHRPVAQSIQITDESGRAIPLRFDPDGRRIDGVVTTLTGHKVPIGGQVSPIRSDETLLGEVLVFEDITELKAVQKADEAFKHELDRRVRERTAELERSNRTLREANETLDAFSYVVGHDLKEPTRAIESIFSLIEEEHADEVPDDVLELFRKARAANRRLSALVVGLLTFSQAAAPNLHELAPVNVAKLMKEPVHATRFEGLLKERNGRLELSGSEVVVLAEPGVLAQVLSNLILNALKHNPKEEPLVRLRVADKHDPGEVHLVVEDDGSGFPASVASTFQTGISSTREGGFGLLIAKRGVARMQGRIWLDRSDLGGAAVHITLPAVRQTDAYAGPGRL